MLGKMWRTKKQNGYTIVETFIVLGVTAVMFTATVLLVNGQIARYRFKDATYNAQQRVQGVLNDVQTGYFDLVNNVAATCNSGSNSQPGDSNCVYVGKRIVISASGQLSAYPLIANITAGSPIGQSYVTSVTPLAGQQITLPAGLDYSNGEVLVLYTNYPNTAALTSTGGAQSTGIFGVDGTNKIVQLPSEGRIICMKDGAKRAMLRIGANSSMSVELDYNPTASECP